MKKIYSILLGIACMALAVCSKDSFSAKCPSGYVYSSYWKYCFYPSTCPAGFGIVGVKCFGEPSCPSDGVLKDEKCIKTIGEPTCPSGTVLKDGKCTGEPCPSGTVLKDGKCIIISEPCPSGAVFTTELRDGKKCAAEPTCPSDKPISQYKDSCGPTVEPIG